MVRSCVLFMAALVVVSQAHGIEIQWHKSSICDQIAAYCSGNRYIPGISEGLLLRLLKLVSLVQWWPTDFRFHAATVPRDLGFSELHVRPRHIHTLIDSLILEANGDMAPRDKIASIPGKNYFGS